MIRRNQFTQGTSRMFGIPNRNARAPRSGAGQRGNAAAEISATSATELRDTVELFLGLY